jgi:cytochrome c peroxidase
MPLMGAAYSPWQFWDGRKDSLWSQATGPLENPLEHGGDRALYAQLVARHYRAEYEAIFGPLPDLTGVPERAGPVRDAQARAAWDSLPEEKRVEISRVFANIGKSIEAYERKLLPGPARFDRYAQALLEGRAGEAAQILSADERAGLRLFIGEAQCTRCHNGPLFTNNAFHNTGVPAVEGLVEDRGRAQGVKDLLADEFNCLGPFSDAQPEQCGELRFLLAEGDELLRQYKPPSLRGVAARAPYMHAGQFATLEDVLRHYNRAPLALKGHSELERLHLRPSELDQIIAFLKTLDSPIAADPRWLQLPE